MSTVIDVRGLSCPQPIIATKRAFDKKESPIIILSDSKTSCENIERYSTHFGWSVEIETNEDEYKITLTK